MRYDLDRNRFFGYDDEVLSFDAEEVQQSFSIITGLLLFENINTNDLNIDYKGTLNAYNLTDNFEANEFGIDFDFGIDKALTENIKADLGLSVETFSFNQSESQSLTKAMISPSVTLNGEIYTLKVGVEAFTADKTRLVPDLEASVQVSGEKAVLFAKWYEDAPFISYDYIRQINPFVNTDQHIEYGYQEKRQIGIKGGINNVQYELSAYQAPLEDLLLFVTDSLNPTRFNTLYDDGSMINVHASSTITPNNRSKVVLGVDVNNYMLDTQQEAWSLPQVEASLGGQFAATEKLNILGEIFIGNGVYHRQLDGSSVQLNSLFDLNLGAEYIFNEKVGFFLDVNNILNNERARYVNYPNVGINFLGGVTFRL